MMRVKGQVVDQDWSLAKNNLASAQAASAEQALCSMSAICLPSAKNLESLRAWVFERMFEEKVKEKEQP
jgi:hypothetical protein